MSIDRAITSAVENLLKVADKYEAKFNTAARKNLETQLAAVKKIDNIKFTGPSVGDAVLAAVIAGCDPLEDPEVRAALTRRQLAGYVTNGELTDSGRANLHHVVTEQIEAFVTALKTPFNKAGTKLSDAHAVITGAGIDSLNNPLIQTAPLPVAKANLDAREALAAITEIRAAIVRVLIATVGIGGTPLGTQGLILDTGDTPAEEILRHGRNLDPWEAISAGYRISLATPTETTARAEHAYDMSEARERATAETARIQRRDTHAGISGH